MYKDEIINGRVSSIAMVLTPMQIGGYTRDNICHPNSWVSQFFNRHHRRLGELEDEANRTDFSGDGIPQISLGLVSDAMQDIDSSSLLYRPKPKRRLAANNTEVVATK